MGIQEHFQCLVEVVMFNIIQLSPEGEVNSSAYRDAKRRGIYPALFTDPEVGSCFSIYQMSWIKMKTSNFL